MEALKNVSRWRKMRLFYFAIVAFFTIIITYDSVAFYPGELSILIVLIGLLILGISLILFWISHVLMIRTARYPLANKTTYLVFFTIANLLLIGRIAITLFIK